MVIRIQIADDHAVFRAGLRALLEKEGDLHIVAETGDTGETLETLRTVRPDVLILDLTMPGGGGARVAAQALKSWPGLAVVVLTMHEDASYLQELFGLGVRAYVIKKSTGTDVIQAIRAAHAGRQYVDPAMAAQLVSTFGGKSARSPELGQLEVLTPREREVCRLLALGHTNPEIAGLLFISERTVESHRMNIMTKLALKSRAELVRFAMEHGLLRLSGH